MKSITKSSQNTNVDSLSRKEIDMIGEQETDNTNTSIIGNRGDNGEKI